MCCLIKHRNPSPSRENVVRLLDCGTFGQKASYVCQKAMQYAYHTNAKTKGKSVAVSLSERGVQIITNYCFFNVYCTSVYQEVVFNHGAVICVYPVL